MEKFLDFILNVIPLLLIISLLVFVVFVMCIWTYSILTGSPVFTEQHVILIDSIPQAL